MKASFGPGRGDHPRDQARAFLLLLHGLGRVRRLPVAPQHERAGQQQQQAEAEPQPVPGVPLVRLVKVTGPQHDEHDDRDDHGHHDRTRQEQQHGPVRVRGAEEDGDHQQRGRRDGGEQREAGGLGQHRDRPRTGPRPSGAIMLPAFPAPATAASPAVGDLGCPAARRGYEHRRRRGDRSRGRSMTGARWPARRGAEYGGTARDARKSAAGPRSRRDRSRTLARRA